MIATATNTVAVTVPLPPFSTGVAVSSDGRFVYVSNVHGWGLPGTVSVVSNQNFAVTTTIPIGLVPRGIAVTPDGSRVYVANSSDSTVSVIATPTNAVIATIAVGANPIGVAVTPNGQSVYVTNNGDGTVSVINTATNAVTAIITGLRGAASVGTFIGPDLPPTAPVVEFYHGGLDHYFITQNADEIADLENGVHKGWARTGQSFLAFLPGQSGGQANRVCRYYGLPSAGLDSHFYSVSQSECDAVGRSPFDKSWARESDHVFEIALPDTVTGTCPAGTLPVYRLWNNRIDSNHRYTPELATRQQMIAKGYVPEGYGPSGVTMCAVTPAVV